MKIKSLLLLIVFVLAACSAPSSEPESTATPVSTSTLAPSLPAATATHVVSESPTMTPEMREYIRSINLVLQDIAEAGNELDELFYLASLQMEYLEDDSWIKLANDSLDRMSNGADAIDAISPVPPEATKAHEFFQLAAEELRSAVLYQREVIQGDFEAAYNVTEHMQAHIDYAQKAFNEIEKIQP
jgi:hypothetical protein